MTTARVLKVQNQSGRGLALGTACWRLRRGAKLTRDYLWVYGSLIFLTMLTTGKTSTPLFWIPLFQSLHHTEHSDNLFQEAFPQNAWKDRLWWHQHLPPRSPCLPPRWCTFCLHWDRRWQPSFFSWFLLAWSTSELSCHKKCDILHRQLALLRPRVRKKEHHKGVQLLSRQIKNTRTSYRLVCTYMSSTRKTRKSELQTLISVIKL